ncbi:MAG: 4Fe-4S binding protein, partial [Bacteroidales bacterium]|nr:4Fe-4S binding protein [Bacteroidales bacterium]
LSYIDFEKCVLCRACVEVCPTNAIWEVNFPPRKPKPEKKKIAEKEEKTIEIKNEPAAEKKAEGNDNKQEKTEE